MIRFDKAEGQFVNDEAADAAIPDRQAALVAMDAEMNALGHYLRLRVVGPISPYEAASWQAKVLEADAGGGPILTAEAQVRGIALEDMVARVKANAQAYGQMEALIAGINGRHRDAIFAMQTREEVLAYDWRAGWPL